MSSHIPLIDPRDIQQSIGCIVTLHCHPFFKEKHKDTIHISGESTMIPPLMMIIEILHEKKTSYEEHSGFEISDKTTYQCKCIWYSLKSHQFEEAWLSSKVLKLINESSSSDLPDMPNHGATVILKTGNIELGKKKATFSQVAKSGEPANTISGLLSFISPTMIVVGTGKHEIKEPLIDAKTGDKKRWIPKKFLKCKYFNPNTDKLSEIILPIEVLTPVSKIDKKKLEMLEETISAKGLLTAHFSQFDIPKTILKPLGINYKGAHYFLEAKDLLLNKIVEILIDENKDQFENANGILDNLPRFEEISATEYERLDLNSKNVDLLLKDKFWRIKYENLQGIVTERTLHSPEIFSVKRTISTRRGDKEVEIFYLKANCLLRNNEVRFFRLNRITRIQVLNLDVPASATSALVPALTPK